MFILFKHEIDKFSYFFSFSLTKEMSIFSQFPCSGTPYITSVLMVYFVPLTSTDPSCRISCWKTRTLPILGVTPTSLLVPSKLDMNNECCISSLKSFIEVELDGDETDLFPIRSPVASIIVGFEIFPGRIFQKSQSLIESNHRSGLPGLRKMVLDPFPDQTSFLLAVDDTSLSKFLPPLNLCLKTVPLIRSSHSPLLRTLSRVKANKLWFSP